MQTIINGIDELANVLSDSKNILLVCGQSFMHLSIRKYIESLPMRMVKFDKFTPNPRYEEVCLGVDMFNRENCDTILAVGGGSAMDVAKCIKLFCKMPKEKIYLEQTFEDSEVPLIAIPTTAGTGSESTRYAVIYYEGNKQSVTHDSIIPNYALLEPDVLKELPEFQKKCTLMDALCQSIESWWSVNSNDESKVYSEKSIRGIMENWRSYVYSKDPSIVSNIMLSANYSGRAINITQTTAPHAFSYKMTSLYGLPHGYAVAIGLPYIWEYMCTHLEKCIDDRGADYLNSVFFDIAYAMGASNTHAAIRLFFSMLDELDMRNPISKDRELDIVTLSTSVNPVRLKNNPIKLDEADIHVLYDKILSR